MYCFMHWYTPIQIICLMSSFKKSSDPQTTPESPVISKTNTLLIEVDEYWIILLKQKYYQPKYFV